MGRQQRALLSLIVAGIFVASILAGTAYADQATLSIQNVQVTNLTDRGFYVTWTTDQPASNGSVIYGTNPSSLISLVPELMGPRADVHRVFVQPSSPPGTVIYYDVKSGTTVDNNGGSHYRIALGQSLGTFASPAAISGQVLQADGRTPAVGVLVTIWALDYSGLDGVAQGAVAISAPLSVLTDTGGNWSLSLETRLADGSGLFKYTTNGTDQIKYGVEGGALGQTSATIFPLTLSANGQVAAPAVSLISGSPTATPTLTVTTGPVLTNTPSATATPLPAQTVSPSATVETTSTTTAGTMTLTPTATAPTATATDVPSPTPVPPTLPPLPTVVPTPPLRVAYSPTAALRPVLPPAPASIPLTPSPSTTVPPTGTLVRETVAPLAADAWPDRSPAAATSTLSTPQGTVSPAGGIAGTSAVESGQKGLDFPAGVGLMLVIGGSLMGLGSIGVALAVVEARRASLR